MLKLKTETKPKISLSIGDIIEVNGRKQLVACIDGKYTIVQLSPSAVGWWWFTPVNSVEDLRDLMEKDASIFLYCGAKTITVQE